MSPRNVNLYLTILFPQAYSGCILAVEILPSVSVFNVVVSARLQLWPIRNEKDTNYAFFYSMASAFATSIPKVEKKTWKSKVAWQIGLDSASNTLSFYFTSCALWQFLLKQDIHRLYPLERRTFTITYRQIPQSGAKSLTPLLLAVSSLYGNLRWKQASKSLSFSQAVKGASPICECSCSIFFSPAASFPVENTLLHQHPSLFSLS